MFDLNKLTLKRNVNDEILFMSLQTLTKNNLVGSEMFVDFSLSHIYQKNHKIWFPKITVSHILLHLRFIQKHKNISEYRSFSDILITGFHSCIGVRTEIYL